MTSAPTIQTEAPSAVASSRARLIAARILVVVASILAAVSVVAGYVRYQALDTPTVENAAGELIANDAIRTQIAAELVDQLYANVDVAASLQPRLPADQQRLAAPIAGALRELTDRVAVRMLERPKVQAAWIQSIAAAHAELLRLLDDRGTAIRTTNGNVELDLRPLLLQLGNQVALVGNLAERLPKDAGRVEIMKADNLRSAQRAAHLLDLLAPFLWIVTIGVAALAVWLAAGKRRSTLRALAIGLIAAGLLVLVVRRVAGNQVVDSLTQPGSEGETARDAWNILTALLADGGRTLAGMGAIALLGVWLAGETRSGRAARREVAPPVARWEIAYGAVAAVVLLLVWWEPTVQFSRVQFILLFTVLLALGVWALRRLILHEHPNAGDQPASAPIQRAWAAVRSQPAPPPDRTP